MRCWTLAAIMMFLGASRQDEIDGLIAKLTDADVAIRDEATAKLIKMGAQARERVKKLLEDKNADVAARARRICEAAEFELLREVKGPRRFAFSPDGAELAYSNEDGSLDIVKIETGESRLKIPKPGAVDFVGWSSFGLYVQIDKTLRAVDPGTGKVGEALATYNFGDGKGDRQGFRDLESVRFIPSGDALVSSDQLFICTVKNKRAHELPLATRGVIKEDGSLIIGLKHPGEYPTITRYAGYGSWKAKVEEKLSRRADWMVAPPDLGRVTLAALGHSDLVQIDPETLKETAGKDLKVGRLTALCIRPDGKWLLVGTDKGAIHILDEARLEPLGEILVDNDPKVKYRSGPDPTHIACSKDGSYVAVVLGDAVRIYKRK